MLFRQLGFAAKVDLQQSKHFQEESRCRLQDTSKTKKGAELGKPKGKYAQELEK